METSSLGSILAMNPSNLLIILGVLLLILGLVGALPLGAGGYLQLSLAAIIPLLTLGFLLLVGGILLHLRRRSKVQGKIVLKADQHDDREPQSDSPPAHDGLSLRDSARTKEVVMYWGYRPVAQDDISSSISLAQQSVFISGMGLNTIADVLLNPAVQASIISTMRRNPHYTLTIMALDDPARILAEEKGRLELEKKLESGMTALRSFRATLLDSLSEVRVDAGLHTLTYGESVYPRHFLLRVDDGSDDDVIYVGSYLSHKRGKYSYLMKLRDYEDGLFAIFNEEIEFLIENSAPMSL